MNSSKIDNEQFYLAKKLGEIARAHQYQIKTAESCTGGGIAYAMTAIPGSSDWFECGVVTYSNQTKQDLLNVKPKTIATYGAVSRQVVEEMVSGLTGLAPDTVGVSVSGIAGPGGGSEAKPVGTVWFAFFARGKITALKKAYTGNRGEIREKAVTTALRQLIYLIE